MSDQLFDHVNETVNFIKAQRDSSRKRYYRIIALAQKTKEEPETGPENSKRILELYKKLHMSLMLANEKFNLIEDEHSALYSTNDLETIAAELFDFYRNVSTRLKVMQTGLERKVITWKRYGSKQKQE